MSDTPLEAIGDDQFPSAPQARYSMGDNARAVFASPELADAGDGAGISLGKGHKLQKTVYLVYRLLNSNATRD